MNKVVLIGNLTRDPELQTTNSGVSVCRFSLAVTRRFANADGGREADFLNRRRIAINISKKAQNVPLLAEFKRQVMTHQMVRRDTQPTLLQMKLNL